MDNFNTRLSEQKTSRFGALSFFFLVLTFGAIFYAGYQLLVQSGHPLFGEKVGAGSFDLRSWSTRSALFVVPIYLISLGCMITAFVKKEASAFKYISAVFHGFFLLVFMYSLVQRIAG